MWSLYLAKMIKYLSIFIVHCTNILDFIIIIVIDMLSKKKEPKFIYAVRNRPLQTTKSGKV